jgi:hypothetical protein
MDSFSSDLLNFTATMMVGTFYGALIAVAVAVLRFARHASDRGEPPVLARRYPQVRNWCRGLTAAMTVVLWGWPYSYIARDFLRLVYHREFIAAAAHLPALGARPAAALATAAVGIWIYERTRLRWRRRR